MARQFKRFGIVKPPSELRKLEARLERNAAKDARHRAELASKDAEIARLKDAELKANVVHICAERSRARGIDPVNAKRIQNLVLTAREQWCNGGQQGPFDVYLYYEKAKHECGLSPVGPSKSAASPLEAALPPTTMGKPPPGMPPAEAARKAAEQQSIFARGQEYAEAERRTGEAYRETLRRLGLENPMHGGRHLGPWGGG